MVEWWPGVTAAGKEFVVDDKPVWRDRANFIVNAELPESDSPKRFEQLWTRQVGDDQFERLSVLMAYGDVDHRGI